MTINLADTVVTDCRGVRIRVGDTVVYPTQNACGATVALVEAKVAAQITTTTGRLRLKAIYRAHGYDHTTADITVAADRVMVVNLPDAR